MRQSMSVHKLKQAVLLVGAVTLLLIAPAISLAENANTAKDVTTQVSISAPENSRAIKLTQDGNVETYAKLAPKEGYSCVWTDAEAIAGVYLKWYEPPVSAILVQIDAEGAELSRETLDHPLYNAFYPLQPEARGIQLFNEDETLLLSELTLYTAGELPEDVLNWQPPLKKADMLVVSAHCDDELLYFGGTIPTYAGERGLAVQVAYMANGERIRVDEALAALWHLGVRNAPKFLPFRDAYTTTLEDGLKRWGEENTVSALAELIRRFQPEVIVSHDVNGEYGHGAHRATAHCLLEAVPLAADAAQYPESAAKYGAWQTQKLYLHLYAEQTRTMDWRVPLAAFGGKTAIDLANEAYDMHVSQQEYHQTVYDEGDFNSAVFGLAYSAVGADEAKDDFFEHVDPARLSNYVAPTPEPTAVPTPEPTAAATASPVKSTDAKEPASWSKWAGLAVGFLVVVVPSTIFVLARMRKTSRKYRRIVKEQGLQEPKCRNERKPK